jgi:hypothetical protein
MRYESIHEEIQGVSFISTTSTVGLSHSEPAAAGTSRDSCGDQDSDKRKALYLKGRKFLGNNYFG